MGIGNSGSLSVAQNGQFNFSQSPCVIRSPKLHFYQHTLYISSAPHKAKISSYNSYSPRKAVYFGSWYVRQKCHIFFVQDVSGTYEYEMCRKASTLFDRWYTVVLLVTATSQSREAIQVFREERHTTLANLMKPASGNAKHDESYITYNTNSLQISAFSVS